MTSRLPVSTLAAWAASQGVEEAVIIGRDAQGRLRIASTHGTLESILRLTGEAEAWATAPSFRLAQPDLFPLVGDEDGD